MKPMKVEVYLVISFIRKINSVFGKCLIFGEL